MAEYAEDVLRVFGANSLSVRSDASAWPSQQDSCRDALARLGRVPKVGHQVARHRSAPESCGFHYIGQRLDMGVGKPCSARFIRKNLPCRVSIVGLGGFTHESGCGSCCVGVLDASCKVDHGYAQPDAEHDE